MKGVYESGQSECTSGLSRGPCDSTKEWQNLHQSRNRDSYERAAKRIKPKKLKWMEWIGTMKNLLNDLDAILKQVKGIDSKVNVIVKAGGANE